MQTSKIYRCDLWHETDEGFLHAYADNLSADEAYIGAMRNEPKIATPYSFEITDTESGIVIIEGWCE